jgi:creatinine amidohydrolase
MKRAAILEDLTWLEAADRLTPSAIVAIPLGAAAKEHGPHLRLNNDFVMAQHLADCLLSQSDVVIAPPINYFYYPAYIEYPGSASLRMSTARDLIIDVCRSFHRFGPWRFYVVNTGFSTIKALQPAVGRLSELGITLRYTDLPALIRQTCKRHKALAEQEGGSHADEIETSIMLHICSKRVDMSKATKDFDARGKGRLSRRPQTTLCYSPSGIWGDATLANAAKGSAVVKSITEGILSDIDQLRKLPGHKRTNSRNRIR